MILLLTFVFVALGFSFLCSIAESVLFSVTSAHIALLENDGKRAGKLLRDLKDDINKPLAAILTLNTIAHTAGAAGAGAQASIVFGSASLGIFSAILTLLILVFSEIIPKTLGAHYWKGLAPITAFCLKYLVLILYPFVKMSELMTKGLTHGPSLRGFNRFELAAMAELSAREGQIAQQESDILKNLLLMRETKVQDAMTPGTVIFSIDENLLLDEFFEHHEQSRFSRIPIYHKHKHKHKDEVTGFVLRSVLLLAYAKREYKEPVKSYKRVLPSLLANMSLSHAFDEFIRTRAQIMLVVDEYGSTRGLITLEDVLETVLGLEIIDEHDKVVDMQKLARRLWKRRAKDMGLNTDSVADDSDQSGSD